MSFFPVLASTRRLALLVPLVACALAGAPNTELPAGPDGPQTAFEKQRASVQRQLSSISEAAARRAQPSAESILERQRAAAEKQRGSVERQMLAVRTEQERYVQARYVAPPPQPLAPERIVAPRPVTASWTGSSEPECRQIPPAEISGYVEEVAKRESLEPELLHVVIAQESSFYPCAVSNKGAMGMMQLMPGTAADLGVTNPFDAEQNIDGGARYLGYLLQRFGDVGLALAAYNAGPTRVDNYGGVPPFPETVDYVSKILRRLPPPAVKTVPARTVRGTT